MEQQDKKKRIIVRVMIVALVVVVVFLTTWLPYKLTHGTLELIVSPTAARIWVGDNEYTGKGSVDLTPGTYEIKVSMVGFYDYTETIELTLDGAKVYVGLEPGMDFAEGWYVENPEDAKIYSLILAHNDEVIMKTASNEHSAFEKLPYNGDGYTISGEACKAVTWSSRTACVIIDAQTMDAAQSAIEYFRDNIDERLGDYYFFYKGTDGASNDELIGLVEMPEDPLFILSDDMYGAYVFLMDGMLYRVLYFYANDTGDWYMSGEPAAILTYDNFVGVPENVIDEINNMRMVTR